MYKRMSSRQHRSTCELPHLQGHGAYPGPLAELDFWSERAANLNAIHEQLSNDRVQKVVKILELANSTYFQAFQRLFQVCVLPWLPGAFQEQSGAFAVWLSFCTCWFHLCP